MNSQQHTVPLGGLHDRPDTPARPDSRETLGVGAMLGAMSIRRLLSQRDDEAIYVGFNEKLKRRFAVREYLPLALTHRVTGGLLELRSTADGNAFLAGMQAFLERAERRAELPQGVLLGVRRVWEENGTAYLCMPFPKAPTLAEVRQSRSRPPDEHWLRERLLRPLLEGLDELHGASLCHGALAPDQVLMLPEGRTVLLDFASPPHDELEAGQAADLRALAGLVVFAMRGQPLTTAHGEAPSALIRAAVQRDELPRYGDALLAALDLVLAAPDPAAGPGLADFRAVLAGEPAGVTGAAARVDEPGAAAPGPADRIEPTLDLAPVQQLLDLPEPPAPPMPDHPPLTLDPPLAPEPQPLVMEAVPETPSAAHGPFVAVDILLDGPPLDPTGPQGAVPAETPLPPLPPVMPREGPSLAAPQAQPRAQPQVPPQATPPAAPRPATRSPVPAPTAPTRPSVDRSRAASGATNLSFQPAFPSAPRPPRRAAWVGAGAMIVIAGLGLGGWVLVDRHGASPTLSAADLPTEPTSAGPTAALPAATTPAPTPAPAPVPMVTAAAPPPPPPSALPAATPAPLAAVETAATPPAATTQPTPVPKPAPRPTQPKPAIRVTPPPPPASAGPRAVCGARTNFALYNCMQQQCRKPQFSQHAQCQALRERDVVDDE